MTLDPATIEARALTHRERDRLDALRRRIAYLERKGTEIDARPINHYRALELSALKWAVERLAPSGSAPGEGTAGAVEGMEPQSAPNSLIASAPRGKAK